MNTTPTSTSLAGSRTVIRKEVLRFAIPGVVLLVCLAAVSVWVAVRLAQDESVRNATEAAELVARTAIEPAIVEGVQRGDPAAIARLDTVVRDRIVRDPVVTVRLWDGEGRIVYSDKPELIGQSYSLGEEELNVLAHGGVEAEVSDLTKPENRLEQGLGDLVEVYLPVSTADGSRYLFELYQRQSALQDDTWRLLSVLIPVIGGSLLVLAIILLWLALRMARRLDQDRAQRERLLIHAVDASEMERKRIAADLHDGVVQELAGVSYVLVGLADRAAQAHDQPAEDRLRRASGQTSSAVRGLRSLLVDIYPPNLEQAGLAVALTDLVDRMGDGIEASLHVDEGLALTPAVQQVVYRVAREALQNVGKHARAEHVAVRLVRVGDTVTLTVVDDGTGFDPSVRPQGHVGLHLLADLAERVDGVLTLSSQPDAGTTVTFAVPDAPPAAGVTEGAP
jgi:two-component system, NarL family, sensor kinase